MKILHVCGGGGGGAPIACRRLNEALRCHGVESSVMEAPPQINTRCFSRRAREKIFSLIAPTTNAAGRSLGLFGGMDLVEKINRSDADLVHLHSPQLVIPIHAYPAIRKKIVWTLHDSWVFCGAELHPNLPEHDTRYRDGYTHKNFPSSSSGIDLDKWIWRWKKHCWKNLQAVFTAPSRWEASCFKESALFRGQDCHVIPNCLDTEVFRPHDKAASRAVFHLPEGKRILLFGAADPSSPNKGFPCLREALRMLSSLEEYREHCHLAVFGEVPDPGYFGELPFPCTCVGQIESEDLMAQLYSAADVFICPSLVESFGYTSLESVSCGTPVAAFRTGGLPDKCPNRK